LVFSDFVAGIGIVRLTAQVVAQFLGAFSPIVTDSLTGRALIFAINEFSEVGIIADVVETRLTLGHVEVLLI